MKRCIYVSPEQWENRNPEWVKQVYARGDCVGIDYSLSKDPGLNWRQENVSKELNRDEIDARNGREDWWNESNRGGSNV